MENKTIRVGISLLSPFVIKTNHGYSGLEIDLWEEIAERLNLKFEYTRAPFDELLGGHEKWYLRYSILWNNHKPRKRKRI